MKNHFIIIGVPKSGSSSIYRYLQDHPDLNLSKVKEYNFFMDMGYDWKKKDKYIRIKKQIAFKLGYYSSFVKIKIKKHYENSAYKLGDTWSGDGSICYFYFKEVPKRIKFYAPESKLILILRNPIDRLYSNYWMHKKAQAKDPQWDWKWQSFEDYIDNGQHIKEINHYDVSMKRWLKHFSIDDFLILRSEDFYTNGAETLQKIENHLGISNHNYSENYWISPHSEKGNDYPEMNINTRNKLRTYFYPHVKTLEKITNKSFNWRDFMS